MHYRSIPGLDVAVSQLALGGWLTLGDGVDDGEALKMLRAACDAGVNMIDLADVYAAGAAERLVGRFLADTDRDRLVLSSKVFWPTSDDPDDRGLSRRHIHASIDRALARLQVERLDLYYCHREDPSVPLSETVEAMSELVRAGKIASWGTSCWQPRTLRAAHAIAREGGLVPPSVEQSPYNLLERWIEAGVAPCCEELGMALIVFSPLAQGALTGKYLEGRPYGSRGATTEWVDRYLQPEAERAVRLFVAFCERRALDPAMTALAWTSQRPGVTSAILGASTLRQLEHNLAAASLLIDDDICSELDRIFPPARQPWLRRLFRRWLCR